MVAFVSQERTEHIVLCRTDPSMARTRREAHAGTACHAICPSQSRAGDKPINDNFSGQGFVQETEEPPEEEAQEQVALQLALPCRMSIVPHSGGLRELRSIIFEVISSSGRQPPAVAQSSELQQNLFVNNSFYSE